MSAPNFAHRMHARVAPGVDRSQTSHQAAIFAQLPFDGDHLFGGQSLVQIGFQLGLSELSFHCPPTYHTIAINATMPPAQKGDRRLLPKKARRVFRTKGACHLFSHLALAVLTVPSGRYP